jgi:hypothetical protein
VTIDMGFREDTELMEAVLLCMGAASVCWDDHGVFMPERAEEIGEALVDFINQRYMPVPDE